MVGIQHKLLLTNNPNDHVENTLFLFVLLPIFLMSLLLARHFMAVLRYRYIWTITFLTETNRFFWYFYSIVTLHMNRLYVFFSFIFSWKQEYSSWLEIHINILPYYKTTYKVIATNFSSNCYTVMLLFG